MKDTNKAFTKYPSKKEDYILKKGIVKRSIEFAVNNMRLCEFSDSNIAQKFNCFLDFIN
jgi:hypothetical protein